MLFQWSDQEWTEIVPGLFQGGHFYELEGYSFRTSLTGVRKFDRVVSLYTLSWAKETVPDEGVHHTVFEFRDDEDKDLDPEIAARLHAIANEVYDAVCEGQKVLVRCQAGYNRSGLVCALVLMKMGMSPRVAVDILRDRRSPLVLSNEKFEEYILSL